MNVSENMLGEARTRIEENCTGNRPSRVAFHRATLADPPLEFSADTDYDGIVNALVLGYIADWCPVFEEFARILRPGGFLVFSKGRPIFKQRENPDPVSTGETTVTFQPDLDGTKFNLPAAVCRIPAAGEFPARWE